VRATECERCLRPMYPSRPTYWTSGKTTSGRPVTRLDAQHIALGRLGELSDRIPRDRDVYVICRSGVRSAHAAQALNAAGWLAFNVADGMHGWESAGRAMTSESGAPPFVA